MGVAVQRASTALSRAERPALRSVQRKAKLAKHTWDALGMHSSVRTLLADLETVLAMAGTAACPGSAAAATADEGPSGGSDCHDSDLASDIAAEAAGSAGQRPSGAMQHFDFASGDAQALRQGAEPRAVGRHFHRREERWRGCAGCPFRRSSSRRRARSRSRSAAERLLAHQPAQAAQSS
jgi:hypothetical protein